MTSVTSLSAYSYSTSYTSSLDRNGDGVVSADELAAAQASGTSSTIASSLLASGTAAAQDEETAANSALAKLSSFISAFLMQATSGESPSGRSESGAGVFSTTPDTDGALGAGEFAATRPEGPPPPPSLSAAETEDGGTADSETSLADFLEQIQSVIDSYLENLEEETGEQSVLLTA